jgi:hypothetical protein
MTVAAQQSTTTVDLTHVGAQLERLRSQLTGRLITAGDIAFDKARKVQDISLDRFPLAIVRAAGNADVAATVNFARDFYQPLVIRSGGHSLAQHSMADGAIVVDLSGLKSIEIDPGERIARVGGGVTSGDLAAAASPYGLALTTGDTSSVGVGGLTTGGGIGFMARRYGLAIDNLISAQVVTATGDVVTACEDQQPDLFWAIRGGGGNFGVVTEFTFRLAPVGQILGGDLLLPATRDVVRGYLDYTASAPDDLTTIANVMHAPPAPFVPEEWVGKLVLNIIVCWTGSLDDGKRAVAPLRGLATPVADTLRPMPYQSIYLSTAHQALPHGASIRSMFADDLSDEALDATLEAMSKATSPYSIIHFRGLGGQMARVPSDATAFAHRNQRYLLSIIGVWLEANDDAVAHRYWTASLWDQIRHEGSGVYVNFLENEGDARIRDAYPPATLARLKHVKWMYDPANLFRFNQNVPPEPAAD